MQLKNRDAPSFRQGSHFRMIFFSLRFSPRFLSLILVKTGRVDDTLEESMRVLKRTSDDMTM